jgi:hypothetical protein
MSLTPVFAGVVKGGVWLPHQPRDVGTWLRSLEGQPVEGVFRKRRTQRSSQANRFYFAAVVAPLAEHCGYERAEMHEVLAMRFLRIEDCPITGAPRRKRTPKCDTAEFAAYVDSCIRLAAELGVVVADPQGVEIA